MTCWRRLRDWNAAGVWEQLHQAMRTRLREHALAKDHRSCTPTRAMTTSAAVRIFNALFVNVTGRYVPGCNEIAQRLVRQRVYFVVVRRLHGSRTQKARSSRRAGWWMVE